LDVPNEYKGEVDDVLEDEADCGTDTETEEEEPNAAGRFGSEEGSVVWQPFIASRINSANP
jgi:hypothetical protein